MEISIPRSKLKLILLGLGALLFVSLGILFLIYKEFFNINIYILIISSYFGIPFFGSILVFISFSFFSKKPAVVINEKGITDNSAMISIGFIEWSEIENIFPYRYINQTFIGIWPKDLSTFLSRFPPFKRFLLSLNKNLVAVPLNIALT
jgi:hypothetical protein